MDEATLDRALTLRDTIATLESVKEGLQTERSLIDTLTEQFTSYPDALPEGGLVSGMEEAIAEFNRNWIAQLDAKIAELQAELDAL